MNRTPCLILAGFGFMLAGMTHAAEPLKLVDEVDLERFQGRWYEIALLPNRFQRRCVADTRAEYRLRDDGRVAVTNRCRQADGRWSEAEGVARKAREGGPDAALEVRFAPRWLSWLPWVWGDYRIIALDEEYRHAMVGTENRRYLWILARSPRLDEAARSRLIEQARRQGFDTDRLVFTPHEND